jgi:hypothetical protein
MDFKKLVVSSWQSTLNFIGPLLLVTLVQLILIIVSFGILAPVTTAGYVHSLMRAIQEERKPQVGDLFSQMRLFLPLFIFSLLAFYRFHPAGSARFCGDGISCLCGLLPDSPDDRSETRSVRCPENFLG